MNDVIDKKTPGRFRKNVKHSIVGIGDNSMTLIV